MIEEIKSQVFTIDDLLLGRPNEVRVYAWEFVLAPLYAGENRKFLGDTAYLGVAERFGKIQEKPFMKIEPFYEIKMPDNSDLTKAKIKRFEYANSLYPHFFKTIFTGPTEAIAQALRDAPFSKMEQLADVIERLGIPYDVTLIEIFEHKNRALAETG